MTKLSKTIKVPTAVNKRSQLNIGGQHVTTLNFMRPLIARAFEMVPGQHIDLNCELFSRLEPLEKPTFGRAEIRTKFFWVPFRTIMPGWNDFITDTPHVFDDGSVELIPYVPFIRNQTIYEMFCDNYMSSEVSPSGSYDFIAYDSSGRPAAQRVFSPLGRFAFNLLRSLGYGFVLRPGINATYSLLPLFSYFKVYNDWFYPSQYANDSESAFIQSLFTNDVPQDPGDDLLSVDDLVRILRTVINITYEPDYFTSAWDNPAGPNNELSSVFAIDDITQGKFNGVDPNVISNNNVGADYPTTPVITSEYHGTGDLRNVSQYSLDALKALTDYLKRHQLAGSRAMDRYLARFGYRLASEKLNRSILIDEYDQQIQFGDVTSTSSTDGASLGDYAGKGLSYGSGKFSFSSDDEYGMFIAVTTIIPFVDYYQGLQRHTLHQTRLDFFTPEFDGLGVQAIAKSEIYTPIFITPDDAPAEGINTYMNGVFGFTSRYAEYKKGFSQLTGDFVVPSRSVGEDSWHLFRNIDSVFTDDALPDVIHGPRFLYAFDKEQYDRIFQNTDSLYDKFRLIFNFDIKSSFPGSRLFDTYEFEDEDKSNKATIDVGGSSVS